MPEPNAVELRLNELAAAWESFAELPAARLLRWVADADARELIEVFLRLHAEHPAGVPDLFVPFELPFADETAYAAELLKAWRAWFDAERDDLLEIPLDASWRVPAPRRGESGAAAVARAAASFAEFYSGEFRRLAVALVPESFADDAGWDRWLHALARSEIGPRVRFLVIDPAEAPRLDELARAEPIKVVTQTPEIRATDIYRELLAEAGGRGPGVVFRKHYVGMLSAAKDGDPAAAENAGRAALAVAAAEDWPDLRVAAQMGLAGVWTSAGRVADALQGYAAAVGFADSIAPDHPAAAVLRVQTRMAEAGARFGLADYAPAAARYEEAAAVAAESRNDLLTMECWRMAAACHALLKRDELAWACGERAVEAGARIAPDIRDKSTLAFAGQGQLRLCAKRPYADHKQRLLETLDTLIGPGWEARRA